MAWTTGIPELDAQLGPYINRRQGSSFFGRATRGAVTGGSAAARAAAQAFAQKQKVEGPMPGGYGGVGFDPGPGSPGDYGGPTTTSNWDPCAYAGSPGSYAYEICKAAAGAFLPGLGGLNPYAPNEPTPGEGAEPGEACPEGYWKVGSKCVSKRPEDYVYGGTPAITGTGWEATVGSFGMPAMTPLPTQRTRLECPTGMVLGKDNLCYPKGTPGLGRRGTFRKWKGDRRPKISAAEWTQLQRAARTREKVKDVAKLAGYTVKSRGRW